MTKDGAAESNIQSNRIGAVFGLVAGLTLATNGLGFIREVLIARTFGATGPTDAFFTAFSVVSFFSLLFLAGPVQGSLMPRYLMLLGRGQREAARSLLRYALAAITGAGALSCVLLFVFAEDVIVFLFPGFDAQRISTATAAVHWLAPIIVMSAIGAVAQTVLHAERRFLAPSLVPFLTNVLIIGLLVFAASRLGIHVLSLGFLGGAALWVIMVAPMAAPAFAGEAIRGDEDRRKFERAFLILAAMIVVDQASAIVQRSLLSHYEQGLISALSYGSRLAGLPIGILVAAMAVVLFPRLVVEIGSGERDAIGRFLKLGILTTIALLMPIAIVCVLAPDTLVRALFGGGRFNEKAIADTSQVLQIYALGLPAQALLVFLEKVYLAAERTRLVVMIGIIAGAVQLLFMWFSSRSIGWISVPLGTLIYAFCHLGALLVLATRFLDMPWRLLGVGTGKIAIATVLGALAFLLPISDDLAGTFVKAAIMCLVYFVTLVLLHENSLIDIVRLRA